MRQKFGPITISIIIGVIAFVFIFFGVFSPKSTRGLHEGSVAGVVNGESIGIPEFNRELNRRMEFFKAIGGGKISEAQLKMFHIKESVFQELAQRKLLIQEADRQGMLPSDEEIRDKIRAIEAFRDKSGRFDPLVYKQVLEANRYTPASFEKTVRDDLMAQQWAEYFKARIRVSDEELKREFFETEDQRSVKYVLMTHGGTPGSTTQPTPEKMEEIRKANLVLADKILPLMGDDKAADAKVNSMIASSGLTVKTTALFSKQNRFIPGVGEAPEVLKDAFADQSPIDMKSGGKAKKYVSGNWVLVAVLSETKKPDLSKLDTAQAKLRGQVAARKERMFFESWMKKLTERAKIEKNPSVVSDGEEGKDAG